MTASAATHRHAFFVEVPGLPGGRFCILHMPPKHVAPHAGVLHVHAFAEEMNKSRRMVSQQAQLLAEAGVAVMQIDLLGCGDSAGDFSDATWAAWIADVKAAAIWLTNKVAAPLWLWGLRAGCLLAAEALHHLDRPAHLLLWQPPASGKVLSQQFVRLRAAAKMVQTQGSDVEQAQVPGQAPEVTEIAGYPVSAELLAGMAAAVWRAPGPDARIHWIELSSRAAHERALLPASQRLVEDWSSRGCRVQADVVAGPAFWQTTEIEDAPALWQRTCEALATPDSVTS